MVYPALFDSPLREELTGAGPELENGSVALPTEPGLGIELDAEAVARYHIPI